mgnify:CR=1 FL=1
MPRYTADAIRNIALVGQSGSGKTTLADFLYGWPIDPAESNPGQSNAGQSLIRDWIDLDGKHGWRSKNMGMRRNYGISLESLIYTPI